MLKGPHTVGRINVHVSTTLFVDANRVTLCNAALERVSGTRIG